jgi:hypothetical protein
MTEIPTPKRKRGRPKLIESFAFSPSWASRIYALRAAAVAPPASMGRPRLVEIGTARNGKSYRIPLELITEDAGMLREQHPGMTRKGAIRQALRDIMRQADIPPRGFLAVLENIVRLDQLRRKLPRK